MDDVAGDPDHQHGPLALQRQSERGLGKQRKVVLGQAGGGGEHGGIVIGSKQLDQSGQRPGRGDPGEEGHRGPPHQDAGISQRPGRRQ